MIEVLVGLMILGVCLYLIELVPMDANIRTAIKVVAILFVVLYLLQVLGFWHGFDRLR